MEEKTPAPKKKNFPHSMGGGKSKRPGKPMAGKSPDVHEKGRPPALTPEVHKGIVDSVELLGMAESRAAMVMGFDGSAPSKWKKRGEAALKAWDTLTPEEQVFEDRYVRFFIALRDAEPKFEQANLLVIQRAAMTDWRAAQARLAMRMPETYGRRVLMGNDPRNPLPSPNVTASVLILPSNGRGANPPAIPGANPPTTAPAKPAGKKAGPA